MAMHPRAKAIRVATALAMTLVVAACGAADDGATPPTPTSGGSAAASSQVLGSELSGVRFEVRRDPG